MIFRASGLERLHVRVIGHREAAADIQDLDLAAARSRLFHHRRGDVQGLHEVVEIGALAAHVEAQPLHHQPDPEGLQHQVHRLARIAAELRGQLHHRPGIGHPQPQHQARVRRVALDLAQFVGVVVGQQRLVFVQRLERFLGLDGVGVDDLVPDEVLALLGRKVLDVLMHQQEFGQRGHVEAGARLV